MTGWAASARGSVAAMFNPTGARDEDDARRAGVLMGTASIVIVALVLALATTPSDGPIVVSVGLWSGLAFAAATFALARAGRVRLAAALLTTYLFVLVAGICTVRGPYSPRFGLMCLAVMLFGSVIAEWMTVALALGFAALILALSSVPALAAISEAVPRLSEAQHVSALRHLFIGGLLVVMLRRGYDRLYREVSRQDDEGRRALEETRRLTDSLEQLAAERTRHLADTRDRVAALASEVAADLQDEMVHLKRKLHAVHTRAAVADPERRADLGKAVVAADRLDAMLANLVEHARLGRITLSAASIDMAALAGAVIEQARGSAAGAKVAWRLDPLPPATGDPVLLRSVLENLIGNAIKFSAPRPKPEIQIGYQDGRYFVRDNGVGFDPGYLDRLFTPFHRLHRREDFEGQGMGLANVRSIIERHGGGVAATGALDGGATFSFTLGPAAPERGA